MIWFLWFCTIAFASKRKNESIEDGLEFKRIRASSQNDANHLKLPFDMLCLIFKHALDQVAEESPDDWKGLILSTQTVCIYWNNFLKTFSFATLAISHPLTAPSWFCGKFGKFSEAEHIFYLKKFREHFDEDQCVQMIYKATDIKEISEICQLPALKTAYKVTVPEPIGKNDYSAIDVSKALLEHMQLLHPNINLQYDSSNETPLLFQISLVNLFKCMAMESIRANYRLTPTFLFVMNEICKIWRWPEHLKKLRYILNELSSLKLAGTDVYTAALRITLLPLILAGLTGEREFAKILPENFLENQINMHINCPHDSDLVCSLFDFYRNSEVSFDFNIVQNYIYLVDEHTLGFMGFNVEIAASKLEAYLDQPHVWNYGVSLLWLNGSGQYQKYRNAVRNFYAAMGGNFQYL